MMPVYTSPQQRLVIFLLDVSDSMRYPQDRKGTVLTKMEYGAYLAAALQYLMIGQRDAAGMTLFDEEIQFYAPAKSKRSWLVPIFKKLEEVLVILDVQKHNIVSRK